MKTVSFISFRFTRHLLLLVNIILFCFNGHAQNLLKQWDKTYGGLDDDEIYSFQQTADDGFILAGNSMSNVGGDKSQPAQGDYDYWIVKIDASGNKQWDKTFGGTLWDWMVSVQQTSDKGYILGGYSESTAGGDKTQNGWGMSEFWVVKTDSLGNKQWDKDFGGTDYDYLYCVRQTRDGGYILGGYSSSQVSGDKTQPNWDISGATSDYWIVKTDANGVKQWDKRFGGIDEDYLNFLQQTTDGGYILGGTSYSGVSGDKTQPLQGYSDYWIVKIDSLGNKQWDKDFGGTSDQQLISLQQTADGGYILGGTTSSNAGGDKTQNSQGYNDYWIVKTDANGNKQWDKDFGGTDDEIIFGSVNQTNDKGYLAAGTSYSMIGGDKTENNLGMEQTWIVKTDSAGNKKWDKTIFTDGDDEYGMAIQTRQGCYAMITETNGDIAGYKSQPNRDLSLSSYDYWISYFCDTAQSLPVANYISSDTTFCSEPTKCISFYDHSTGNPVSWQWLFPGATPNSSTQQNPTNICYYSSGTFPVTLIVTNAAGTDTFSVSPMITVGNAPIAPTITVVGTDTLISSHGSKYQWYFNGSPIPGATDSFYIALQKGLYSVLISESGCNALSGGVMVGINELAAVNHQLMIFPNPANEEFWIYGLEFTVGGEIEVYSVLGEKIYNQQLQNPNSKPLTIDCRSFAPGIYFVKVANEKGNCVGRFIKE